MYKEVKINALSQKERVVEKHNPSFSMHRPKKPTVCLSICVHSIMLFSRAVSTIKAVLPKKIARDLGIIEMKLVTAVVRYFQLIGVKKYKAKLVQFLSVSCIRTTN